MKTPPAALWRHVLACALVVAAAGSARAEDPTADEIRTAQRIRAERAAADATYERTVKECAQNFVVSSCVESARAERHAAHLRLDREQQALDEAKRLRRAEERRKAIEAKTTGEEAQAREAAARARSQARSASEPARAAPLPASGPASHAARPVPDAAQRAEQEARARRAYELKQLQAEAHRREVEQRNAERARKTSPGAPLPVPPEAAASTASAPAR